MSYSLCAGGGGGGELGWMDSGVAGLLNFQRQVLHGTPRRLGQPKTSSAVEMLLAAINAGVRLKPLRRFHEDNAYHTFEPYEVVVKASDNFPTKFLVNDVCYDVRQPFATAGIPVLSGHAMFVARGQNLWLRYAVADVPEGVPTTGEQDVINAAPATTTTWMVTR